MRRIRFQNGWIFSPLGDLAAFLGPLVAAGLLTLGFARAGLLHTEVPPWAFAVLVIGCDVAHVWATLFRTYLDPAERARRPGLLTAVPLACLAAGVLLYAVDGLLFWRVLAYVAAFHFVRQQWGWMSYAARRAGESSRLDRRLDQAAIYASTVFPLLWWHAHLPREFAWFVEGDFATGLAPSIATAAGVLHVAILAAWIVRQLAKAVTGRPLNLAKALVLATTWCAWVGGIVLLDSDIAFTASNVLAHGVPYFVLIHRWGASRWKGASGRVAALFRPAGVFAFVGVLVALAYAEETLWDGFVWHQHAGLFALPAIHVPDALVAVLVPLLAVPQASHYVLDAFLWRTGRDNPDLGARLGMPTGPASA